MDDDLRVHQQGQPRVPRPGPGSRRALALLELEVGGVAVVAIRDQGLMAAMDTVRFAEGALDRARVKVPVLPWLSDKLEVLAVIEPPPPLLPPLGVQVTDAGAVLVPE